MAHAHIAEILQGAKEFVLHVADEVSFKARHLLEMDPHHPRRAAAVESFDDEGPTLVCTQSPLHAKEGDHLAPLVDRIREWDIEELTKGDESLDAEMLAGARREPVRPSPVELALLVAPSMLTPISGGSAQVDPLDR